MDQTMLPSPGSLVSLDSEEQAVVVPPSPPTNYPAMLPGAAGKDDGVTEKLSSTSITSTTECGEKEKEEEEEKLSSPVKQDGAANEEGQKTPSHFTKEKSVRWSMTRRTSTTSASSGETSTEGKRTAAADKVPTRAGSILKNRNDEAVRLQERMDIAKPEQAKTCAAAHDIESNDLSGAAPPTDRRRSSLLRRVSVPFFDLSSDFVIEEVSRDDLDMKRSPQNAQDYVDGDSLSDTGSVISAGRGDLLTKKPSRRSIIIDKAFTKLFGDNYSSRESAYVLIAGGFIAFNSGFVNGSCLSGFLNPNQFRSQSVAGFTSMYTRAGLALADGKWGNMGFFSSMILSYMLGAFISGLITPRATPYQIEPTYGPTFLIGGVFLLVASILAAFEPENMDLIFYFAAAANGIQNGIASIYSANLIRCSLTGSSTDIALFLAQILRGNKKNLWKGLVLSLIVFAFWMGGIVSFYATQVFLSRTLFINAALFWLIGISLIYFLMKEIGVSFRAAIFGSWKWKSALTRMTSSMHPDADDSAVMTAERLLGLFDEIDLDQSGALNAEELYNALNKAGVKLSRTEVAVLVKAADRDGNGEIDRDEWGDLVYRIF